MQCGGCGEQMEDGRVEVHGTVRGFLLFGYSLQDLFWYEQDRARTQIVASGTARPAYACKSCGLLTINTLEHTKATRGRRRRYQG